MDAATALRRHWPEYLMEAWGLGTFMVSAGLFTVLFLHPASPLAPSDPLLQRALIGVAINTPDLARHTGLFAGLLVTLYITLEAPLSGMSMNPARTLASALPGGLWQALWVYLLAPPLGMLLAVELCRLVRRDARVVCAKLDHHTHRRCIFRCGYAKGA